MKYTGMEWIVIDTPIQLKEVSSIATPLADKLKLYAKDKAGVSALYYKDDAGNEKDLSGGLTGSGTANRLAYWTSTTVLAANAALTQNHILVADVNGLPTGNASAQITNLTGDVALTLKGTTNGLLKIDGAATGNPYIEWAQNGTFKGRFQYLDADDSLALSVNGAERFRFGSAGQLGIGGATYGTAGYLFKSGGASAAPTWTAPASVTAGSSKITLGGTPTGAAIQAFSIDVAEGNLTHNNLGGLTTGDPHTQYRLEADDHTHQSTGAQAGTLDHGLALTGLTDDDHTGYALLAGRSGGQILIGGTAVADDLTLRATAGIGAGSEGIIFQLGNNGATEAARFFKSSASANYGLGIGTTTPDSLLHVTGTISNGSDNANGFKLTPTFTGAGNNPRVATFFGTFQPSATIASSLCFVMAASAAPATGIDLTNLATIYVENSTGSAGGTISGAFSGLTIGGPSYGSTKPATAYGVNIGSQGAAGVTNAMGIVIQAQTGATNNYDMYFTTVDTTAAGAYYGRVPVLYNGLLKYLHLFSA